MRNNVRETPVELGNLAADHMVDDCAGAPIYQVPMAMHPAFSDHQIPNALIAAHGNHIVGSGVLREQAVRPQPAPQLSNRYRKRGRQATVADQLDQVLRQRTICVTEKLHDYSGTKIGVDESLYLGNAIEVRFGAALLEEDITIDVDLLTSTADSIVAGDHLHAKIVIGRVDVAAAIATNREWLKSGEEKGGLEPRNDLIILHAKSLGPSAAPLGAGRLNLLRSTWSPVCTRGCSIQRAARHTGTRRFADMMIDERLVMNHHKPIMAVHMEMVG